MALLNGTPFPAMKALRLCGRELIGEKGLSGVLVRAADSIRPPAASISAGIRAGEGSIGDSHGVKPGSSALQRGRRQLSTTPVVQALQGGSTLEITREEEAQREGLQSEISSLSSSSLSRIQTAPSSPAASGRDFASLGLSSAVLSQMELIGLNKPTPVQASAIPILLQGRDAALQSYTGSGKTLAYLLPLLSTVGPLADMNESSEGGYAAGVKQGAVGVQAVIVTPSRELAMQIVREAERILGPQLKRAVQQLIGGANMQRQEEALKKLKPTIVVGTPGRISELSRTGRLQTHGCRMLVLDEADALLSHAFRLDMLRILEHVGHRRSAVSQESRKGDRAERQTVLVSATMPPAVLEAAAQWGHHPLHIVPGKDAVETGAIPVETPSTNAGTGPVAGIGESLPPNLKHWYVVAPQRHKLDVVRRSVYALNAKCCMVFMNYGRRLQDAQFKLNARGISVDSLHGGMGKVERSNVLSSLRLGKLQVLVVSEVAARGVDVPECDLVVNLELPTDGSHYAHRAGRAGRLGRRGIVITICEEREEFVIQKLARQLGISIARGELVEGKLLPYEGRMKY